MTLNQSYFKSHSPWQSPWFWYFVFLLFLLFGSIEYCHAEKKQQVVCDTVVISSDHIVDIVAKETKNGNIRTYAVYKNANEIEILPISQSLLEYLKVCKKYNVTPYLGMRIRNGKPISIIKMQYGNTSRRNR